MTEMHKLSRDVQDILAAAVELQDLAYTEDGDAPWRSRASSVPVTGGGVSDPTFGAADDTHKYADRDRIATTLSAVAHRLRRELTRQRPVRTGVCRTERCKGDAYFDGYCDRCDVWRRNNPGLSPADIDGLVEGWNDRLPRFCDCSDRCCPDGCHDLAAEGRSVSEKCKKRMQRARAQERQEGAA